VDIARVLIATRGEIARRLLKHFAAQGFETVLAFAEAEVDLSYMDDADYTVYLNGRSVEETYAHPSRVLSAALDAGCDVIHPGYCFLSERLDFFQMAANANMPVIGCVPQVLATISSRISLREVASSVGISLIPASETLPEGDDGVAYGAQLGFPLFVKATDADVYERVDSVDALPGAVERMKVAASGQGAPETVYLERVVETMRQINTTVVADHHGFCLSLGSSESTIQSGYRKWVEEIGPHTLVPELRDRLDAWAVALATALGWVGVCVVRWAVTPDGGAYLLGMSARLTTGYSLIEHLHGVDLVDAQFSTLLGKELEWGRADTEIRRHCIQMRVIHVDTRKGTRPEGVIERLVLPTGPLVELGCEEGQVCSEYTDPLLLKLTVSAPTRAEALVQAREALGDLLVDGVSSNLKQMRRVLDEQSFAEGTFVTSSLTSWIGAWAVDEDPKPS
jgi:acetyl-CoA/propionyl-CoA carboxylase biotin carboxyl carrier protein